MAKKKTDPQTPIINLDNLEKPTIEKTKKKKAADPQKTGRKKTIADDWKKTNFFLNPETRTKINIYGAKNGGLTLSLSIEAIMTDYFKKNPL